MSEPLSEEQLRIAEIGASHETDVLCAEIRRLWAWQADARNTTFGRTFDDRNEAWETITAHEAAMREVDNYLDEHGSYASDSTPRRLLRAALKKS